MRAELERDPLDGDCFLFVNRARSRAKVLLWDGTGLCIYMKRLEQGRFACLWETGKDRVSVELTMSELALFLEGSEMVGRIPLSPTQIRPMPVSQGERLEGLGVEEAIRILQALR